MCTPHATPANHTTISTSLSLSSALSSLWSPGHTTTLVPHRPPPPVFHTTFRVPVLDHPYSKLWAGGQGRQAQRRRGTRHTTNRMTDPQTRWVTRRTPRRQHDTLSDGHRDNSATPHRGLRAPGRDPPGGRATRAARAPGRESAHAAGSGGTMRRGLRATGYALHRLGREGVVHLFGGLAWASAAVRW